MRLRFTLRNGLTEIGVLEAYFFGQSLSGETHAALDYVAEQLPAAIDLCRLLDEKLRLERELADRLQYTMADLGYRFPEYPVPAGETMDSFLRKQAESGAVWRSTSFARPKSRTA